MNGDAVGTVGSPPDLAPMVCALPYDHPRFREPAKGEVVVGLYREDDGTAAPVLLWADTRADLFWDISLRSYVRPPAWYLRLTSQPPIDPATGYPIIEGGRVSVLTPPSPHKNGTPPLAQNFSFNFRANRETPAQMVNNLAKLPKPSVTVPRGHRLAQNWGETKHHPNANAGQSRLAHYHKLIVAWSKRRGLTRPEGADAVACATVHMLFAGP
jgi:hypothetical protein